MINKRELFNDSWDLGARLDPKISPLPAFKWPKFEYVNHLKEGFYIVIKRVSDSTYAIRDTITDKTVTKYMSEKDLKHFMLNSLGVDITHKFKTTTI